MKSTLFSRNRGRLIAFSGLDSAGKSTQIDKLIDHLKHNGYEPQYLWTRGGYTQLMLFIKKILRLLMGRRMPPPGQSEQREKLLRKGIVQHIWLTLAVLDLILVYGLQIRWWLWQGKFVVCDRYIYDSQIDFKLNFGVEDFQSWWLWRVLVWITPTPDNAFLLTVPVEESIHRSKLKNEPFPNTEDELQRRASEYTTLAKHQYWQIIDGLKSVSDTQGEIKASIAYEHQAYSEAINAN